MLTIITILVGLISIAICRYASAYSAVVAFLGVEGTVLLASAFSTSLSELGAGAPESFCGKIHHWLFKVPETAMPLKFSPFKFWVGLILIAVSTILSAITIAK